QTVHRETNPRYHALLTRFKELTGCPVLVNTSFNVRGEPIACTPEDAFHCFMGSEIDCLAIGNFFLHKADQDPALRVDYRDGFDTVCARSVRSIARETMAPYAPALRLRMVQFDQTAVRRAAPGRTAGYFAPD